MQFVKKNLSKGLHINDFRNNQRALKVNREPSHT